LCGAEDQHKAERDQRVDGADADTSEKQLEYEIHENARRGELKALLLMVVDLGAGSSWVERSARGAHPRASNAALDAADPPQREGPAVQINR